MTKAQNIKGMRGYNDFISRVQAVIPDDGKPRLTIIPDDTETSNAAPSSKESAEKS